MHTNALLADAGEVVFPRVAILGLGLMGASLGMALREKRLAEQVVGYDRVPSEAVRAKALGAVDLTCASRAEAVLGSNLIVLATPIASMEETLAEVGRHLDPEAVVTDLASTKAQVVAWASSMLPEPAHFVGGHPMTGSEQSGVDAARADLFDGSAWCLTPTSATEPSAIERMSRFIAQIGAEPVILDPTEHDEAVALVSHLPRLAAVALTLTATTSPHWPVAGTLAAGGFRDTTRVASGSPGMLSDICSTNSSALLTSLDAYLTALHTLRDHLAAGDVTVREIFTNAKEARDSWEAHRTRR